MQINKMQINNNLINSKGTKLNRFQSSNTIYYALSFISFVLIIWVIFIFGSVNNDNNNNNN